MHANARSFTRRLYHLLNYANDCAALLNSKYGDTLTGRQSDETSHRPSFPKLKYRSLAYHNSGKPCAVHFQVKFHCQLAYSCENAKCVRLHIHSRCSQLSSQRAYFMADV